MGFSDCIGFVGIIQHLGCLLYTSIYVNGTVNDIAYRSNKLEPVSVIAFGWPDEEKELPPRRETAMVHYDRW